MQKMGKVTNSPSRKGVASQLVLVDIKESGVDVVIEITSIEGAEDAAYEGFGAETTMKSHDASFATGRREILFIEL